MKMTIKLDLEIAKDALRKKNLTLVIVKEARVILESRVHGVSAFLEALESLGAKMKGASVADRVVGKAVALLCIHAGVQAVYTITLSLKAKQLLEKHAIYLEWETVVDRILNASGTDFCPFEKAVMETDDPREAYEKLKAFQNQKNAMSSDTKSLYP